VKKLSGGDDPIAFNSDRLLPIASLTKLVTAEVARSSIVATEHITITDDVIATYGNTAGFRSGETTTAGDLIYPLLMVSSNDAAEAYAEFYGRKKFIQAMNDFAQSIGAYRTYFSDPSGLSAQNVSTANDMVVILDWLRVHDPGLLAITELKAKTIRSHTWINPTHFLSWSNYVGGKNGYTDEANRTAASLFTLGPNKDLVAVVVLGSSARDADELKLLGKIEK
jgi:D-alanyl-D-alanine carboxypeptidase